MIQIIPTPTFEQPHAVQRTALDGTDYILTFDWNERSNHWHLSIADENDNSIIDGIKLVANFSLLRTVTSASKPPGLLFLTIPSGEDPTLVTLYTEATLAYVPVEDLE